MSAFFNILNSFEIFVSSIVIFSMYFIFFNHKKFFIKHKDPVTYFGIILILFFQHILFEALSYFFSFNKIMLYRSIVGLFLIPFTYYFLFKIRKKDGPIMWFFIVGFYTLSVFTKGITYSFNFTEELLYFALIFDLGTLFSFYCLVLKYFLKNNKT